MAKENNNSNKRAFENAVEPVTKRRALQDTTNIPQSSTSLINVMSFILNLILKYLTNNLL